MLDAVGPAVVLGSSQSWTDVDEQAAERAGVEIARRQSGGGAVLIAPGSVVWVDFIVPAGDPLWDTDIGRAAWWVGDIWAAALERVGVAPAQVWREPLRSSEWSRRICFAGVGAGEVTVEGTKVVGVSQRRTRSAALSNQLHCCDGIRTGCSTCSPSRLGSGPGAGGVGDRQLRDRAGPGWSRSRRPARPADAMIGGMGSLDGQGGRRDRCGPGSRTGAGSCFASEGARSSSTTSAPGRTAPAPTAGSSRVSSTRSGPWGAKRSPTPTTVRGLEGGRAGDPRRHRSVRRPARPGEQRRDPADRFLVNMTEEEWDSVIRSHLKGHFVPLRHASAYWRERRKAGDDVARLGDQHFVHLGSVRGSGPGQLRRGEGRHRGAHDDRGRRARALRGAGQRDQSGGAGRASRKPPPASTRSSPPRPPRNASTSGTRPTCHPSSGGWRPRTAR